MEHEYGFDGCLGKMAARIDEAELPFDDVENGRGWGQFLDGPKEHPQVGPYGVCSGVIVRSLAGRAHSGPEKRAVNVLVNLLERFFEGDEKAVKLLGQNLRLAFLCLALRTAGEVAEASSTRAENELLSRRLTSGAWGHWWVNGADHDPTPRVFVTAIVTLCLSLFRRSDSADSENSIGALTGGSEWLVQNVQDVPDLSLLSRAAAVGAIAFSSAKHSGFVRKQASDIASSPSGMTNDLGVYFYDFQFRDAQGETAYARDYFIVPTELLCGIVGFANQSGISARLRAIGTIDHVKRVVMTNDGAYRSSWQQRISTKNQAWAAIALKLASMDREGASWLQRCFWFFAKPRTGPKVDKWFPVFALVSTTILSALVSAGNPGADAFKAFAMLIVGGLYAPNAVRHLIKGRA